MKDLSSIQSLVKEFYSFAKERMGFKKPVRLFLRQDATNASDVLGKTAYYDPKNMTITVYVTDRHPKDILRSFSHELVHHKQNCDGKFKNMEGDMGEGYAQNNQHLREMEGEAYLRGSLCFRDWTDRRRN